ncbi:unnamed protein product, partial [marine sediment metagenome]
IRQLTPVSSSNVKGVGQRKNELLVQFHPRGGIPQRTYRYQFGSPDAAAEAYNSLTSSGSPGRWVWENIRGHRKGEKVTNTKLGPSLSPPGTGDEVIGGTTASLVDYTISNRVPVSKMKNFDKLSKQLRRQTSNPTTDPNTGSRLEALLGSRKGLREQGLKKTAAAKQLPRLDFAKVYLGNVYDLVEDATFKELGLKKTMPKEKEGAWKTIKGTRVFIKEG